MWYDIIGYKKERGVRRMVNRRTYVLASVILLVVGVCLYVHAE